MIQIHRTHLLDELHDFLASDHGVLLGVPGVGKSELAADFVRTLESKGMPALFIPVEDFGADIESEIISELGIEANLIEWLNSHAFDSESPDFSVVVIDGYDALREPIRRQATLRLARKLVAGLNKNWRVLLSSRTYDARISRELNQIFDGSYYTARHFHTDRSILARHLETPVFDDAERASAISQIEGGDDHFSKLREEIKELLRIPLNIWLFSRILESEPDEQSITAIESETQLIGAFWNHRVIGVDPDHDCERLIESLVTLMLDGRTLSLSRSEINSQHEVHTSRLISEGILKDGLAESRKVSFAHNTLFDYAVYRYVLPDDRSELATTVLESPQLLFFVRRSFEFLLVNMWKDSPHDVWEIAFEYCTEDSRPEHRLFTRILLALVISRAVKQIEDFEPLLEIRDSDHIRFAKILIWLLQTVRTGDDVNVGVWLNLIGKVAENFDQELLWELAVTNNYLVDRPDGIERVDIGVENSRRLIRPILENRGSDHNPGFDRIAATWLLTNITKFFDSGVEENSAIVQSILRLIGDDPPPTEFFFRISTQPEVLVDKEPEVYSEFVKAVFHRRKVSDDKTNFGGPVLSFQSTRAQDFDLVKYNIVEKYPEFTASNFDIALDCAISLANDFALIKRKSKSVQTERFSEAAHPVQLMGQEIRVVPDGSVIWDATSYKEKEIEIAGKLLEFVKIELVQNQNDEPFNKLWATVTNAPVAAFWWRRIFVLLNEVFPLLTEISNRLLLTSEMTTLLETNYEAALLLSKAAKTFDDETRLEFESKYLQVVQSSQTGEDTDYRLRVLRRFLSGYPQDFVSNDVFREKLTRLIGETAVVPEPIFSIGEMTSSPYTTSDFLADRGIDTKNDATLSLLKLNEELAQFRSAHLNEYANEDQATLILPTFVNLYQKILESELPEDDLLDTLYSSLAGVSACIAGTEASKSIKEEIKNVLETSYSINVRPSVAEGSDFDLPSWSPNSKTEAARGIIQYLAKIDFDSLLSQALTALSSDEDKGVRFIVVSSLPVLARQNNEYVWETLKQRARQEQTASIRQAICVSVSQLLNIDKEAALDVLKLIAEQEVDGDEALPNEAFVNAVMGLYFQNETWASELALRFANEPRLYHAATKVAARFASEVLLARYWEEDPANNAVELAARWLSEAIPNSQTSLKELDREHNASTEFDRELIAGIYAPVESLLMKTYFHLDSFSKKASGVKAKLNHEAFRREILPLVELVIEHTSDGVLFAPTAHYLLQALNLLAESFPEYILRMTSRAIEASKSNGYPFDSMAIREIGRIFEYLLADHKELFLSSENLGFAISILNTMADAGWPEALRIFWDLDRAFR